uniref:Uncharacterized protein n=1 Tax=Utricularia reniformis TaxID=192314 RepID=A0A1Y0B281_9LAMI|nr:hypothetical protein AEK19_MT1295 [Utricularia reniformis]ART31498.1 hypothetical protein AEK19_MT1295 [Utricularia reniformis]
MLYRKQDLWSLVLDKIIEGPAFYIIWALINYSIPGFYKKK